MPKKPRARPAADRAQGPVARLASRDAYCGERFSALASLPSASYSVSMYWRSAGPLRISSCSPASSRNLRVAGAFAAFSNPASSSAIFAGGVPFGASTPRQSINSSFGMPRSRRLDADGSDAIRSAELNSTQFALPDCACCNIGGTDPT